jgi:hypothetical protein
MEIGNKIKCVLIDFEQGEITLSEATNTILRLFNVIKSAPLIEGKTKSNVKNNTQRGRLAPPPPPLKR